MCRNYTRGCATPIKESPAPKKYHPSRKEREIVECLSQASDEGLSYTEIREKTGLSDTGLTKLLRRLVRFNLILKDRAGMYHLAILGFRYFVSLRTQQLSEDERRVGFKRSFLILWNEVHELHEKVRQTFRGDQHSMILQSIFPYNPDLIWVAALKGKDGRRHLLWKQADLDDLRKLGYATERPSKLRSLSKDEFEKLIAAGRGKLDTRKLTPEQEGLLRSFRKTEPA